MIKPELGLVSLSFDRLRLICRHEKGGYYKEIRGKCKTNNCSCAGVNEGVVGLGVELSVISENIGGFIRLASG